MSNQCLIGELVTIRHQSFFLNLARDNTEPCIVISAKQANVDPLNSSINIKNSKYPWVYYVLTNSGKIKGPLFATELNVVSTVSSR